MGLTTPVPFIQPDYLRYAIAVYLVEVPGGHRQITRGTMMEMLAFPGTSGESWERFNVEALMLIIVLSEKLKEKNFLFLFLRFFYTFPIVIIKFG